MSLREIGVRGRQEIAKLNERVFRAGAVEMSDGAFLREFQPGSRNCSGEGSAALIAERIDASTRLRNHAETATRHRREPFLPSLTYRDEIVESMHGRFAAQREQLIDRAERALAGRFDLLGFKDLSFGDPIDWLLEPISGKRSPLDHWSRIEYLNAEVAGDKKITWELNRHGHFITLGQAYFLTGDERYARGFVAQAGAWMDANPARRGINWSSSLEVAFRSIAWLWALALFAGSPSLSSRFLARLLKTLIAQGRHIEDYLSHYFSPNTHLTGEALGLFYLGAALPELRRARAWRDTGLRILIEQLPRHVRSDGVYFEQSSYYHRYTADFYIHVAALTRAAKMELSAEVERGLSLLLDHLMWIARPDGSSPLIGDDDGGRLVTLGFRQPDDFRDTLAAGAAMFGRADWKFVAGDAPVETLWLLGPEGLAHYDRIHSGPPKECSHAFEEGGYYVIRDGWAEDSTWALVDCGPHGSIGGGHAHADALGLEFAAGGQTWLVDPGTFTYTGDPRQRDWFRSTEAHNTVTVDGESQSTPAGPFSWSRPAQSIAHEFVSSDGFDYFEGSHDGYQRLSDPVNHTRSLLLVKGEVALTSACESQDSQAPSYVIIRDAFTARVHHRYAIRYHFPAGCSAMTSDTQIVATQPGDELCIQVFGSVEARPRIEEGWVSRGYGQREAAPVGVIEAEGSGPQEFVSIISIVSIVAPSCTRVAPWTPVLVGAAPSAKAMSHCSSKDLAAGQSSAVRAGAPKDERPYSIALVSGSLRDVILFGDGFQLLESGAMVARASVAFARFASGRLRRALLIHGTRLEAGGITFSSPIPLRSLSIRLGEDGVEISIEGTDSFELDLPKRIGRVRVNGSRFVLRPGQRRLRFGCDECQWRLEPESTQHS